MGWILWASLGYFCNAIALTVDKSLLGRREIRDPAAYTLFSSLLAMLVLVLAPWGLLRPTVPAVALGLLSGAAFALALWLMFSVLQVGEASRVPALIGSVSPLFVFFFSWLGTGELLSLPEMVAFALLVAGGLCMVGGQSGLKGRWLVLALVASAAFAISYIWLKQTFAASNFVSGLIWSRVGALGTSLLLLLIPGTWIAWHQSLRRSSQGIKVAFVGGQSAGAIAGLLTSYAITRASVTLVNALQGLQYVFLLLLAFVVSWRVPQLFRDEFSRATMVRKVSGTLLICAGLAVLSVVG